MKYQNLSSIQLLFKARENFSHKGTHGHTLLVSGSLGKMGSALISARACLRAGTGLLTVNIPLDERMVLQAVIPEAMVSFREDFSNDLSIYSAIGIGPGIGLSESNEKLLKTLIQEFKTPIVIDADALNLISTNLHILSNLAKNTIITPHPKEFDRLFGSHKNQEDRIDTAKKKAKELGIIIVLKDHQTLIASADDYVFNTTGNAGLAKGGSGDALLGIITAFLAQGYTPFNAAKLGVFVHGLAADFTLDSQSLESMLISDVIENMGKAFKEISH